MNSNNQLTVKLVHCGNINMANPDEDSEKYVFYMPMGLFSLGAILRDKGFNTEIIHLDLEARRNIDEILDFDTLDAVGFDLHWVNQSLNVLDTVQLIKGMKPDVHVFLGGYTASFFAGEILKKYPAVDTIIRGDAEIPLVELCEALRLNITRQINKANTNTHQLKKSLKSVRNLVWRNDNEIVFNKISYISTAQELDQFGFSEIDLLRNWEFYRDLSRYWTGFSPLDSLPVFFLEIGRGCCYNCTICGGNSSAQVCLNNRSGQIVRSNDSVINSIKRCISFGYSSFFACFDFEGYQQWYINLFRSIKEEKLDINFVYECWSLPTNPLLDVMAECCNNVLIAISPDSGAPHLRKQNKDLRLFYTNRELEECLDYIRTKPNVRIQLWFGFFLPGDSEKTVFDTMDYIIGLFMKYSPFIEITYMNINTDPGSSLYTDPTSFSFDIAIGDFQDCILKLNDNYRLNNGETDGLTLFSKPACFSEEDAVDMANKITFFNHLFYFKDSLLLLLKKTKNTHIITDGLKKIDLSNAKESDFTANSFRDFLLDTLKESIGTDNKILHSIDQEYKTIVTKSLLKKIQFYRPGKKGKSRLPGRTNNASTRISKKESQKFAVSFDF